MAAVFLVYSQVYGYAKCFTARVNAMECEKINVMLNVTDATLVMLYLGSMLYEH